MLARQFTSAAHGGVAVDVGGDDDQIRALHQRGERAISGAVHVPGVEVQAVTATLRRFVQQSFGAFDSADDANDPCLCSHFDFRSC